MVEHIKLDEDEQLTLHSMLDREARGSMAEDEWQLRDKMADLFFDDGWPSDDIEIVARRVE